MRGSTGIAHDGVAAASKRHALIGKGVGVGRWAGVFGIRVAYAVAGWIGFGMQNRSQPAG